MTLRLLLVLSFLHVPSLARLGGNSREVVRDSYRLLSETQVVTEKPVANGDGSKSGGKQSDDTTPGNNPVSKPDRHTDKKKDDKKDDAGTASHVEGFVPNTDPSAMKQKHLYLAFSKELNPKKQEPEKVKNTFRNTVKKVFEEKNIVKLKGSPTCDTDSNVKNADCQFPYFPNQLGSEHKEVLEAIKKTVEDTLKEEEIEVTEARWHKHDKEKTQQHHKDKTPQHHKAPQRNKQKESQQKNPQSHRNPQQENKQKIHLKVTFSEDLTKANQKTLKDLYDTAADDVLGSLDSNEGTKATCSYNSEDAAFNCEFPTTKQHGQKILKAIKDNEAINEKLKELGLKKPAYEWGHGSHHQSHKSGGHRGHKGKTKEETADSASPYSSSTLTVLAAVICILLLGLLSVFLYRFLCKKDLATIASETPKSKKKSKKTKTMGKKKFAKLENNFSSSSDDEKN